MLQSQKDFWRNKLEEIKSKRRTSDKGQGSRRKWEDEILAPWTARSPERNKDFQTSSEIPVSRIYTSDDLKEQEYERDLGLPGSFPFTRGIYPTMYRGKIWTMRMFSGYGSPEDTNRRLKYLIQQGETGLSIAFDMPTLYGFDADNARSDGEVGKCGCNISSLRDMEVLVSGIPLDKVSTSMTINAPAAILTAMYAAAADLRGIPSYELRGTVQTDILKEYIAQKEWVYPPEAHMRIIRDLMIFCTKEMPKWNYISISGYHIREAGANAVQELAFTLADGFTYLELGKEAGLDVSKFAPRLSFFFNSCMNFFEEVAKFRAARRIWATVLKEKYGIKDERALLLRFHTQTSGASLMWQQPLNNIVRTSIEALAAVLGGTQSLHTNSYDEAWALPTEQAVKIALRTQQIIAEETGITDTIDPLGGSYYVEWLTDEMEERAYRYLEKIESQGGVIEAIKKGYLQKEVADAAYRAQQRVENGKDIVVGANEYVDKEEKPIDTLKIDAAAQKLQIERLRKLKEERDITKVRDSLRRLKAVYKDNAGNSMYEILRAVKAYATLQEIVDTGREVFGEWREPSIL